MVQKASSLGLAGSKVMPEFIAISNGICTYIPLSAIVTTTNVVLGPGTGTWTGPVTALIPNSMSSMMILKASESMVVGRDTRKFFDAISFGVCQTIMSSVIAQGTVVGGGPGTGTGKVTGLVPSNLEQQIVLNLGQQLLVGGKTNPVISAVAYGICTYILSAATIIATCIGFFAPPPTGPIPIPGLIGTGKLV